MLFGEGFSIRLTILNDDNACAAQIPAEIVNLSGGESYHFGAQNVVGGIFDDFCPFAVAQLDDGVHRVKDHALQKGFHGGHVKLLRHGHDHFNGCRLQPVFWHRDRFYLRKDAAGIRWH